MTTKVEIRLTALLDDDLRKQSVYDEGGIADHADCIMGALVDLDCEDPDVSLDLEEGTLEICATVDAPNQMEGFEKALTTIRAAIHECGGWTPGWESLNWKEAEMHPVADGPELVSP